MKKNIAILVLLILVMLYLTGCDQAHEDLGVEISPAITNTTIPDSQIASTVTITLTPTPNPTFTHTSTMTPTPTSTKTNTPSPTPTPQTLGRIFPEGFHGQAVWSNAGGNASRNYVDTGWFCPPPDYESTHCTDHVIHFDISLPNGFTSQDPVLSPVDGIVSNIYSVGDGEFSIVVEPNPPFAGIEGLLDNQDRIDTLAKSVFSFDYDVNDVTSVSIHLAHVVPLVRTGHDVVRGQTIANVFWNQLHNPKKIAFVIYIHMKDGTYWQFSPCDVPNEDEFCGRCTPGTIYPCP